ncbi:hypothetical protein [Halomonas sp. HAL1]|jgi:hypothetical protein|uniref:hypothetical protein n=1 Tax=Halomonas sp. HAL1 TaxID=550984 RepID=UPI00022D26FB|nr:hypothetical protein [Halomonas sp. HAL1]EHA15469.1 hypothetical protein HAL1_11007 [Halomonas sp. HAL1]WKV91990.1 hypothetical protein Q3Y66_14125 [Halomonas sp. HAL1]
MTRVARVEPISQKRDNKLIISGWRVIDVTEPSEPQEISQHETEPQAIDAARRFEAKTAEELGSDPDDTQDYDASDEQAGKRFPG